MMRLTIAITLLAVSSATLNLRKSVGPGTATAMAGLEGSACSEDEYGRFETIVCKVEEACGCADTRCELDWCADYIHEWKKEFGACILKGCPASDEPTKE